ncbi:MAG: N-acetylglucosamine-6-phosphate deacetylase [Candidatus Neomarinimicrobiota bacterium]
MLKIIKNCRLFNSPHEFVHIVLEDDKIKDITPFLPKEGSLLLDAKGDIVAPGLIDIHIHGAGGANPAHAAPDSMDIMSESLCKMGTTSFLPTAFYEKGGANTHLSFIANHHSTENQADNLGLHLEGPFINPLKKGGIPIECTAKVSKATLKHLLAVTKNRLKMLTIAPELPGIEHIIHVAKEQGFISSLGHTDTASIDAQKGIEKGISCITHLHNAMRKYNRDKDHPLEAILNSDCFAQIIPDGKHLKAEEIKYFYEHFTAHRLICITDGIDAMGLPDGEYNFAGKKYRSEKGLAFYSDGSGMIGTTLSLFNIMLKFKDFSDSSLEEAICTATENPARCLKIDDHKGFIKAGYDADLIIINKDEKLKHVIKAAKLVF